MENFSHPTEVGQRIKGIRKEMGLSMDAFGAKIDSMVKSGTVSNWETGKNLPNKSRLEKIAKIGDVSIDYLLYGDIYDFLNKNLHKFVKEYFLFVKDIYPNDLFHTIVSRFEKEKVDLLDLERIKRIAGESILNMLEEFWETFDERLKFIIQYKHLKELVLLDLSTRYKYFNNTAKIQVKEIFENAVIDNKHRFVIVFKEVYNSLNYILNNAPSYININALNMDENYFLTRDYFYNSLEKTSLYIKNKFNTYSSEIESYYLLVELENDISNDVRAGCTLLVENFPQMEKVFFFEHFIDSKVAIIHNDKIHIGNLNENYIYTSEEIELTIDELDFYNSIFPIKAIFY